MSDVDLVYKATLDGSGFNSGASGIISQLGMMGSAAGIATVGLVALAAGVVAVGAALAASVAAAASWQTSLTEISKTTGVQGKELEDLSNKLQEIRMQTGATADSISSAVVTAGSIGIPKAELAEFAVLSQQMAGAFRMSADAAANAMGLIGNVVKPAEMSWVEFGNKAGSSINVLADKYVSSEEQILTGMTHLTATMGLLKPPSDTIPAWTALVSTVQSLGLKGDAGGEAIQDAMMYSVKNAKNEISDLLGISGEQLQLDLRSNAPEVMKQAALAIKALPLDEQGAALANFGMTGSKAIQLLMGDIDPLTGQFTMLDEAIGLSNQAFEEGTGLQAAYSESQKTAEVAMERVKQTAIVIGERIGDIFLPGVSSALNGLADLETGVANALSGISEKIKAGDLKGAIDLLYNGLESGLTNIGSLIVDYFRDIDYKAIGQNLFYALEAAWKEATGLFQAFINSDASLAGAFSAIGDVLGPTFESIFGSLKYAATSAYLAIGDGLVGTLNKMGAFLAEWINIAVGYFAKLAGAVDYALGGALSSLFGITDEASGLSSASSGITRSSQIDPNAMYSVTNSRGVTVQRQGSEIDHESKSFFSGNTVMQIDSASISSMTTTTPTATVTANSVTLSMGGADINKEALYSEMYGAGKLHIQEWQDPNDATYEQVKADTKRRTGIQFENPDDATYEQVKADTKRRTGIQFENPDDATYDEVARSTERATEHTVGEMVNVVAGPIVEKTGGVIDAIKEGSKLSDDASALEKKIVGDWHVDYKDATMFSETAYGQQLRAEQQQYEELKAAREALHKQGLDDTKGAKDIEAAIEKAGDKIAENVAAAVTGQPAAVYDKMFQASFQGQTVDYGPTAQENMQRQADAALVNAQYGITALGSMGGYTMYAREKMAEAGIEQTSVNSLIDEGIAKLQSQKTAVDDVVASTENLKTTAADVDFAQANSGAKDLESTCVQVEHSMENISHKANTLRDGIFETGNARTPARTIASPQAATTQQSSSASNAQIASQTRYLAQIANGVTTLRANLVTTGNRLYGGIITATTTLITGINPQIQGVTSAVNAASSAISGAISAAAAAIVAAIEKSRGGGGGAGPHSGMGGLGSVGSFWDGLNASSGGWSSWSGDMGTMSYSTGGYASNPTLALVGDSPGGEYMVPAQRLDEFVTGYMNRKQTHLDAGNMQSQLFDAVSSLNIPAIRLPIMIDIDSEAIYEAVEYAIRNITSDIRLRARI